VKASPQRRFKTWQFAVVCVLAATTLGTLSTRRSHAQSGTTYTITDLGPVGATQSRAYGINNASDIVGDSIAGSGWNHPFYRKGSTTTDITLGATSNGGAYSVNASASVVGYSEASGVQRGFFWHDDDGDGVSDPNELRDFFAANASGVAYDVNDSNRVVGLIDDSGQAIGNGIAFTWDFPNGPVQPLSGTASLTPTRALGINNAGNIAGWAVVSVSGFGPTHAFVLKNSTYIDLRTLDNNNPARSSFAWRISEDNHVVGYSQTPSNNASIPIHAFVWFDANSNNTSDANEMIDLKTLSGDTESYAYDINTVGYVVGTSQVFNVPQNTFISRAFIWRDENCNGSSDAGEMKDLNTLVPTLATDDWSTLQEARAINDSGKIVGWGTKTNGETHAFLLIPSSLPSTEISSVSGSGTFGGTATLTATLTSGCSPLSGKTISFTVSASSVCGGGGQPACPTTNASGIATLSGVSLSGINAGSYPSAVGASFAGDSSYASSSGSGTLTVTPAPLLLTADNKSKTYLAANPSLTFTPTGFVNGDTASVLSPQPALTTTATTTSSAGGYPITFSNSPANSNYTVTLASGTLTINKATPTVNWNNPADITYGTLLSSTQLNATATNPIDSSSVTGTFTYTPAAGTALHAGNGQTLRADFAPTDTTNYNTPAQKTVSINVLKAALTITADAKSKTYLAANPTLTFTPTGFVNSDTAAVLSDAPSLTTTATTTSSVGPYPITVSQGTLSAADYTFNFVNGTLTINKATPVITWSNPADITYGTALSSTQLNPAATNPNDSSSVAGSFSYTPPAGTVLHAGNGQTLRADFTPTDTTNYNTPAQKTVSINVLKATLTITADNKVKFVDDPNPPLTFTPTGFVNGDTASVLTGAPSLSTTATNNSPVGNYPITITQGTLAAADYTFSFVNGTLTITEPAPVLLLETGTNNAAAVDSVTFVRGPFRVVDNFNFSSDHLTRIIIFTSLLNQPDSTLMVRASGIDLPIENVGTVSGVMGLNASYIVVKLRPELTGSGPINYDLTVTLRGVTSNSATLTIIP
jgi:probable HAF family extracellular repeat protein